MHLSKYLKNLSIVIHVLFKRFMYLFERERKKEREHLQGHELA